MKTCSRLLALLVLTLVPAAGPARVSEAFREPIVVYNNWAAYDELSDTVELTEELAMRQLHEVLRLRAQGVRIDAYVMDAYWFARDGGYRTWRQPNWPDGPDRWLAACRENGLTPGLWFSTNNLSHLDPHPAWADSLTAKRNAMCLFAGGYLSHLMETLQLWYDRGVRIFKFDFAKFTAATPEFESLPRDEIIRRNETAWREALAAFRTRNPDAIFQAYNGYGGDRGTWRPHRQDVDLRWLEVFDSLYSGDPGPADLPAMNFVRSVDIFSDHKVRRYAANGVPLERIDSCSPMIGRTGTAYWRGKAGWQGMVLQNLARGSWMNLLYGDLTLLTDEDARWFARAQRLFLPLQARGRFYPFGGVPGEGQPYGFAALGETGSVYTVVNPSQTMAVVPLPLVARDQLRTGQGRVLFTDAGFVPVVSDGTITLGPEQMAVVGYDRYANDEYDLGVQQDIVIPRGIEPLALGEVTNRPNLTTAAVRVPAQGGLRLVLRQHAENGEPLRSRGGQKPPRISLEKVLRFEVRRGGEALSLRMTYDRSVWSGMSCVVAEVPAAVLKPGEILIVHGLSAEPVPTKLTLEVYRVETP